MFCVCVHVCLIISDRDKIEELTRTKCYLEHKEYVKGQKMFSDQIGCYACICDENFDNTTIINSPNCQKVKCNIEIYAADRLMAGCIPIYYGKKYGKFNCCPIDWRCRKYFIERNAIVNLRIGINLAPHLTIPLFILLLHLFFQLIQKMKSSPLKQLNNKIPLMMHK